MGEPATLLEGKYEILNKLREGGMGTLYRVRHRLLDEVRVIKVMRAHAAADADLGRRFFDEARMATRLKHPNICTILDFALDEEGTAYLVMEYIDGVNLSEFLGVQGSPGLPLGLEIAHQALLALGYLHRKSIVHRDVAPDNLMLTRSEDDEPLIKLIDLGIAKLADRPTEMTATGVFLGKLRYASPEQFGNLPSGERVDGRSDLYSLGVVLYELLTGTRPFPGESPGEMLRSHLFVSPIPFAESDPEGRVPTEVREVIFKALEKKREDRFATADDFNREIQALQRRFNQPEDRESSRKILAALPTIVRESREHVTPSAQDRLNRQFAGSPTPDPSRESYTLSPTFSPKNAVPKGSEAAGAASAPVPKAVTTRTTEPLPAPQRFGIPRSLLVTAAALALVAVIAVAWRLARPRPEPASAPPPAVAPTVPPRAAPTAAGLEAQPTLPPPPPTPEPELPRPSPPRPLPDARMSEAARTAAAARESAERARAPERASAAYGAALEQERRAIRLASAEETAAARIAFGRAARLYAGAAIQARAAVQTVRPAAIPAAPDSTPLPRPEPTRPAVPSPPIEKAEKEAIAAPNPVPPPARTSPSEQDRIRDTMHRYERAQSTLDADLYARVFPTVDRSRIERAFQSLASQSVEFEIRKIQVEPSGTRATVEGYEKRIAVPRAGTEQRASGDRVLVLEKRGETWIIVQIH